LAPSGRKNPEKAPASRIIQDGSELNQKSFEGKGLLDEMDTGVQHTVVSDDVERRC
jgi:hypothetical protein